MYMEFYAANMGVSTNPLRVNISLNSTRFCSARVLEPDQSRSRESISISFTTFVAFMALPFFAAAVATYPAFLIISHGRDHIPGSIDVQGEGSAVDQSVVLVDNGVPSSSLRFCCNA